MPTSFKETNGKEDQDHEGGSEGVREAGRERGREPLMALSGAKDSKDSAKRQRASQVVSLRQR